MGVIGVQSLILRQGQQNFSSDIGNNAGEYVNDHLLVRQPLPGQPFGMRSVGAVGFPRRRIGTL